MKEAPPSSSSSSSSPAHSQKLHFHGHSCSSAIAIPCSSSSRDDLFKTGDSSGKKKVIVVLVKGASEPEEMRASTGWASEQLAGAGDVVVVLGLLTSPLLTKVTSSTSKESNDKVHKKINKKRKEMAAALSQLYANAIQNGVKLYLDVRNGKVKALGIGHTMMLKATHVVLSRELKMYKKYFVDRLPCVIIQMRRKSPPSILQGIQSTPKESITDVTTSIHNAAPSQFSVRQSSLQLDEGVDSDLFSTEMKKQPLSWPSQEKIEYCSEIPEGSIFVADTLKWLESIYLKPPMIRMGRIAHCNSPIASATTSRTSSFRSFSTQCNNSEFLSCNSSNNYADASQQFPLSPVEEVVDETKDAVQIISAREHPMNIQEGIKVISVHPRIALASHLVESLLIGQGITSDAYPFLVQQEQHIAANSFYTLYPGQSSDNVNKIMSLEQKSNEVLQMAANLETITSLAFDSRPFSILEKDHFYSAENSRNNFALISFVCPICKQVPPNLGRRPVSFSHDQLSFATNSFSKTNLLGEEETGLVYKGLLKDGHYIVVKQLKQPCIQGEDDFLTEIELLSCAQHRNLVMLLGYCAEDTHFMLVYEYVCNKFLSWHLANKNSPDGPEWWARQKIAVGTARGLRYLHEECYGGCIVHRDIRAENIYLTHDFSPMIGNFGLASLQQAKIDSSMSEFAGPPGCLGEEFSWKTDVYAFGVVLLELITGRQAMGNSFESEQQKLVDWARPLLLDGRYHELLDSRLESSHDSFELVCMVRAATSCITEDPSSRPRMSQVLRILEGGNGNDGNPPSVKLPLSEDLSLLQCDQKDDTNPKSKHVVIVTDDSIKPKKTYIKPRRVTLTYDEMLQ